MIKIFSENKLPCGKVRSVDEVFNDPHNDERGIFHEIEDTVTGKLKITNTPIIKGLLRSLHSLAMTVSL